MLDVHTHFKSTETFQYTHFSTCRPSGGKKRIHQRRGSKTTQNLTLIKNYLKRASQTSQEDTQRTQTTLSEVTFEDRSQALRQKRKQNKKILPFVTQYHPAGPNLKPVLMDSWHFITQQPLLNNIFKEPPLISYKRGRSLKEILVRAKTIERLKHAHRTSAGL